jgi:hypothetical protein
MHCHCEPGSAKKRQAIYWKVLTKEVEIPASWLVTDAARLGMAPITFTFL